MSEDDLDSCASTESVPPANVIETRDSTNRWLLTQLDYQLLRASRHFIDEGFQYLEVCFQHTDGNVIGWGPVETSHSLWRTFFWIDQEGGCRPIMKGSALSSELKTPISVIIAAASLIDDMRVALQKYVIEANAALASLKTFNDNYDAALAATGEPPPNEEVNDRGGTEEAT